MQRASIAAPLTLTPVPLWRRSQPAQIPFFFSFLPSPATSSPTLLLPILLSIFHPPDATHPFPHTDTQPSRFGGGHNLLKSLNLPSLPFSPTFLTYSLPSYSLYSPFFPSQIPYTPFPYYFPPNFICLRYRSLFLILTDTDPPSCSF